jgi:hypothetical protein
MENGILCDDVQSVRLEMALLAPVQKARLGNDNHVMHLAWCGVASNKPLDDPMILEHRCCLAVALI